MNGTPRKLFLSHTREFRLWPADRSFAAAVEAAAHRSGDAITDMEYFTAVPAPPADYCRQRVLDSDVYIGLIGFMYGSAVEDLPLQSYTELEFDTATSIGLPRLIFMLREDASLPRAYSHDGDTDRRQEIFRRKVRRSGAVIVEFSSASELELKVLQALYELPRSFDGKATEVRTPWMAPSIESQTVGRPAVTDAVLACLCDGDESIPVSVTALVGAGGFGKSTIARMVSRMDAIRSRFRGGLLWVSLAESTRGAELASKVNDLIEVLSRHRPTLADPLAAGIRLGEILSSCEPILLVIDDVWSYEQLEPFLHGGEQCERLVTTRMGSILPSDVRRIDVQEMSAVEAEELLTRQIPGLDLKTVDNLIARTGRWPVLIALANSSIRRLVDRGMRTNEAALQVLEELRLQGPTAVDRRRSGHRAQAVALTVEASLNLLSPVERDRFRDIAIFGEGVFVPASALGALWDGNPIEPPPGSEIAKFMEDLLDLSLVSEFQTSPLAVRLHDVIRAYLRIYLGNDGIRERNRAYLAQMARFIDGSEDVRSAPWWLMPVDEKYAWLHLGSHFEDAGWPDEWAKLATDLRWIAAKLELVGPVPIEADLHGISGVTAGLLETQVRASAPLLEPFGVRCAVVDTLFSRLDEVVELKRAVQEYRSTLSRAYVSVRWRRVIAGSHPRVRVNSYSLSEDGRYLAVARDGAGIPILDTSSWEEVRCLDGHRGWVVAASFGARDSWLLTASNDGTARVWDLSSGVQTALLKGHRGWLRWCAVAPDGRWVATAGADHTVRIWDPVTGEQIHVLTGHTGWVSTCSVSPDGSWMATASDDKTVRIWASEDWSTIAVLEGHTGWVTTCVVGASGDWMASSDSDGSVIVWDATSWKLRSICAGHTDGVKASVASRSSSRFATASNDGTIRIWDGRNGEELRVLRGHTDCVRACAFGPRDEWLISGGQDGSTRIWDPDSGEQISKRGKGGDWITACAAGPSGTPLVVAPNDDTVELWDAPASAMLVSSNCNQGWVRSCAVAPAGDWFVTCGNDGTVYLRSSASAEVVRSFLGHVGWVQACAVSDDGQLLATGGFDQHIRIWDVSSGVLLKSIAVESGWIIACCFAPDSSWISVGTKTGAVSLWDPYTGALIRRLDGHDAWVQDMACIPGGRQFASVGYDSVARIWDVQSGRQSLELSGHTDGIRACAAAPDGQRLATAGTDATLRIWDLLTGDCTSALRFDQPLTACCWLPSGELCVGASDGFTIVRAS